MKPEDQKFVDELRKELIKPANALKDELLVFLQENMYEKLSPDMSVRASEIDMSVRALEIGKGVSILMKEISTLIKEYSTELDLTITKLETALPMIEQ